METFKVGDVISFCDSDYVVIENNGNSGVVWELGSTGYLINFQWKFGDELCKFRRRATEQELISLGLVDLITK